MTTIQPPDLVIQPLEDAELPPGVVAPPSVVRAAADTGAAGSAHRVSLHYVEGGAMPYAVAVCRTFQQPLVLVIEWWQLDRLPPLVDIYEIVARLAPECVMQVPPALGVPGWSDALGSPAAGTSRGMQLMQIGEVDRAVPGPTPRTRAIRGDGTIVDLGKAGPGPATNAHLKLAD